MNRNQYRNHEFGLSNSHQALDRYSAPTKTQMSKHLQGVLRNKRTNQLSAQTPEELEQERMEGAANSALRENPLPTDNQVKAIWQQQIEKAKMTSGQRAEAELLKSQDHIERFAGLVQERYAISREDASRQVVSFLRRRHS